MCVVIISVLLAVRSQLAVVCVSFLSSMTGKTAGLFPIAGHRLQRFAGLTSTVVSPAEAGRVIAMFSAP